MRALKLLASMFIPVLCCVALPAMAQCSWTQQPTGVAFGAYSVFTTSDSLSNGNFSVTCTALRQYVVALSRGGAPSYTPRRLSGAANYNLYGDAGLTTIWGDGTGTTATYGSANWTFGNQTYTDTIYGDVPALQDLAPGAYSDTITATLSYAWSFGGGWTALPGVTFPVTMNIAAECRVDTFTLNFGNYNPLSGAALSQSSTVKVYCTKTTPATISLDNGTHASGAQKRMLGPGPSFLNYTASLSSTSGTSSSSIVPIAGGVALNGVIAASQDVPTGSYVDTLQALVNY